MESDERKNTKKIIFIIICLLLLIFFVVSNLGIIEITIPIKDEETFNIAVFDQNTTFSANQPLDIFGHKSRWTLNNKIAPGTQNSYKFVIKNSNDFDIKYDLEILETNKYNVNMKYRLKENDLYIVGDEDDWVTTDELMQKDIKMEGDSYKEYTLDWKWFENENDTDIGKNIEADYELSIALYANKY